MKNLASLNTRRELIFAQKYEHVMWLDADGSMTPLAMGKLLRTYFKYINLGDEKIIIGSRFIEGGGYKGVKDVKNQSILSSINNVRKSNDSVFGMLLSILINKLLAILFRSELTDLTSGFIVLRKEHIDPKVFENKDYGEYFIYLIGSLIKKNLSIKEVGYICETRLHGYSKTGSGIIKFIKEKYQIKELHFTILLNLLEIYDKYDNLLAIVVKNNTSTKEKDFHTNHSSEFQIASFNLKKDEVKITKFP